MGAEVNLHARVNAAYNALGYTGFVKHIDLCRLELLLLEWWGAPKH